MRSVALIWCCLLFGGLPFLACADDVTLGTIKGDVQIRAAGSVRTRAAEPGLVLRTGDRVMTGTDGWVVLLIPDGSRVVLTAGSEFQIRSLDSSRRSGAFTLLRGMLRAVVTPSTSAPPDYRFYTRAAVAGLRGTDFALISRDQANVYFGNNGKVEVRGVNTDARFLTAGTVVQSTRGLLPTQPILVESGSPLAEAQALINAVTEQAPVSWIESGRLPEIIARWNVNYSRYLADAGREQEALHVLQVALDLSDEVQIQADAHLERGAVYSRDPARVRDALEEYAILAELPLTMPQREIGIYMAGLGLQQIKQTAQARVLLEQYLREYPQGRYRERVETLLNALVSSTVR